jgi:exopolyphosphatase/pppGpp-phosphohydrolase
VRDGRYARGESRTLGALAQTERFVRQDPPSHREVEALRAEIDAQLSTSPALRRTVADP